MKAHTERTRQRGTALHDPCLVGNGAWCSSYCEGKPPPILDLERFRRGRNECGGNGRVVFAAETIVANAITEARVLRRRSR
ncbi:hypothetical protein M446_4099 [Methylobacterium sp. 4-46]|nr:hypothetical protein M446_4099 [Methylobacterium sp. 4-46]